MRKVIVILIVVFASTFNAKGQDSLPTVFIFKNQTSIQIDSLLKEGKLNISDTSYLIDKFTWIITRGCNYQKPVYGENESCIFSNELKIQISKDHSQKNTLLITDIFLKRNKIKSKSKNTIIVNF